MPPAIHRVAQGFPVPFVIARRTPERPPPKRHIFAVADKSDPSVPAVWTTGPGPARSGPDNPAAPASYPRAKSKLPKTAAHRRTTLHHNGRRSPNSVGTLAGYPSRFFPDARHRRERPTHCPLRRRFFPHSSTKRFVGSSPFLPAPATGLLRFRPAAIATCPAAGPFAARLYRRSQFSH